MATCKVKSFSMSFGNWNLSLPGLIWKTTTIRLPVKFKLELEEGCTKADCVIGQNKQGRVETGGRVDDNFAGWQADGEIGHRFWWDGKDWYGGSGDWSWFGETATFEDEPGFNDVPLSSYPLYWGGVARAGLFKFQTYVMDKASMNVVETLTWGMLINFTSPPAGGIYMNACTTEGYVDKAKL